MSPMLNVMSLISPPAAANECSTAPLGPGYDLAAGSHPPVLNRCFLQCMLRIWLLSLTLRQSAVNALIILIMPSFNLLLQGRGGPWKHHKEERMEVRYFNCMWWGFKMSFPACIISFPCTCWEARVLWTGTVSWGDERLMRAAMPTLLCPSSKIMNNGWTRARLLLCRSWTGVCAARVVSDRVMCSERSFTGIVRVLAQSYLM